MEKKIYQKIENCKKDFLKTKIDKKGNNTYVKFKYFRLDELIPILVKTTEKEKLATNFTIENDIAKLKIVNLEDTKDEVTFTAPFFFDDVAKNKSQEIGKSITYFRRYLLLMAFDIIEEEILDQNLGKEEDQKEINYKIEIRKLANEKKLDIKEVAKNYNINPKTTNEQAKKIFEQIKKDLEKEG